MFNQVSLIPIGVVHSPIHQPLDDIWGGVTARIELDASRFSQESLAGLDEFSHVEIVFLFDRVEDSEIHLGARHPRGRTDGRRSEFLRSAGRRGQIASALQSAGSYRSGRSRSK